MRINHQKAVLILCAAAILLIPVLRSAVLPFALALFMAGCFQRPMAKLEMRHIPRWLSSLAILLIGLAPLLLLLGYGILSLAHSVRDIAQTVIPRLQSEHLLDDWLYRVMTALPPSLQEVCRAALNTLAQQKDQFLGELLTRLGAWSSGLLTTLPSHLGETGLFLLSFLFCAISYPEISALLRRILPEDWRAWAGRVQRTAANQLGRWCSAESKLVGLIFLELALGLALLRIKRWFFFAALIALVDLLPLVGSGLMLLPWAAIRLLMGDQLQALGLVLIWICVWTTRTVMEPKLVGRQLQLPSAISFFAAILGAKVWGLKGLILFPVLAAVAISFLSSQRVAKR